MNLHSRKRLIPVLNRFVQYWKKYVCSKKFESLEILEAGVYDYIEMWYNKKRCIVS